MSHQMLFGRMQVFTTALSTTLLLVLLGTTTFLVLAAHNLEREVRQNLVVTLVLDDALDSIAGQKMTDILGTERYVSSAAYISKEQALIEEQAELGLDPTDFLDANPFYASIELHLAADYACSDSIGIVTSELEAKEHVDEVLCQRDLVDSMTRLLQRVSYVLLGLAALLTIISFTLIANTVRLSIYSKRQIIYTMRLVGASWWIIRRPFVGRAFWVGLVSALISTAIVVGGVKMVLRYDPTLAVYATNTVLAIVAATVLAAGVLLTTISAAITVNRSVK